MTAATPAPQPTSGPSTLGPVPHRRTTLLWALGAPALVTAAGSAVALSWRDELPDPLASHWGPDGVDGYASLGSLVAALAATALLTGVLAALLGTLAGRAAMTRRLASGVPVGLAVLLQGVLLSTVAPQRGLADASTAPVGEGWIAAGIGLGLALGALAAWLTPGDAPLPAVAPPPADAPRLALGEGEQAAWTAHVGSGSVLPVVLGAALLVAVVGGTSGMWWLAVTLAVAVGALCLAVLRWTVTVGRDGLTARSALRRPSLTVPLAEVERAEVVRVAPLRDFGGWGLRTALDGRTGVVLRGGEAIEVHRSGGRRLVVTVDDAATGAALLNTLASRRAASA